MDWLQFFSSILVAWAWPVAIVVVALIFRKQFVLLLEKLHSLEGPGIKANFSEQVVAVGQQVDAQLVEVQQDEPTQASEQIREIVEKISAEALRQRFKGWERFRPSAMVIEAWSDLESELLRLFAPKVDGKPVFGIAMLEAAQLPSSLIQSITEMRDLRNDVIYKAGFEPSMLAAERYQRNASHILTLAQAHKAMMPVSKQMTMGHAR